MIGPGASFSSSNVILAEINEVADQDSEGPLGSGSLKAESELLDPWESPFESSLPVMRCRKHGQSTSAFGAACEPLPWHDFPSGKGITQELEIELPGCHGNRGIVFNTLTSYCTAGLQRKVQIRQVFYETFWKSSAAV